MRTHEGSRSRGKPAWLRLLVALLLCVLTIPVSADEIGKPPNIVLIYADDLGYGDVSCYGATRVTTPNIDRIAHEGLRFLDGHSSAATCTPSRYAMMTGEYAWRKKGTGVLPGDAALIVEPGRVTLAAILQQAGYATGVVGKWHLGLGRPGMDWNGKIAPGPLEIGFDSCFVIPATGDRVPCVYVQYHRVAGLDPADPIAVSFKTPVGTEPTGRDHPELLKLHPSHGHDFTIINGISRIGYQSGGRAARWVDEEMADVLTEQAVAFLERHADRPFFLYFAYHDIHVPRVPHPRFAGKSEMGPRGDVILQLDHCTGEILNTLDRLKLTENTLVIFTSDNGPVVNDGYKDEAVEKLGSHRPAGPYRGGKYSNFEGGTRVPFLARWPGTISPGTSSALISQIDFPATFAALVQRPLYSGEAPDSENHWAALIGKSPQGRGELVEQARTLSLRSGNWKFIEAGRGPPRNPNTQAETGVLPTVQLYDLDTDMGETTNLAESQPERVAEMRARLMEIREQPAR